jgi:hypothetical protein
MPPKWLIFCQGETSKIAKVVQLLGPVVTSKVKTAFLKMIATNKFKCRSAVYGQFSFHGPVSQI